MDSIISVSNQRIKDLAKLLRNRDFRDLTGLFAVEGATLAGEAAESSYRIHSVFYTDQAYESYKKEIEYAAAKAGSVFLITGEIAGKASALANGQGIFTVLEKGDKRELKEFFEKKRVILLDSVRDPSNLGAIARSALAFGFDSMILSPDCADRFSPKTQRAAMGALMKIAATTEDMIPAIKTLRQNGFFVGAAAVNGDSIFTFTEQKKRKIAVVIGNEAAGLDSETQKICDAAVTIKTDRRVQSLNAAVAASIMMYCLREGDL